MEYLRYAYDWISGKLEKDALHKVIQGNNNFAFQFYLGLSREKKEGGNILFSPAAVQIVSALLWVGSSAEGRQKIEEALQLPPDRDTIVYGFKALLNQLQSLKYAVMNVAIRFYTPNHVCLKRDFYVTLGHHYAVRIIPTVFHTDRGPIRDSINNWVKKNTMNRVDQIIVRQRVDDGTQMLVVNGVNFDGKLAVPFLACDSTAGKFAVSSEDLRTVRFLNQTGMYRYGELEELHAKIIELQYKSPTLSLLVLLPLTPERLEDMETSLLNVRVLDLLDKMTTHRVHTSIPKFRLLEGYDATDEFYEVNMECLVDNHSGVLEEVSEANPPLNLTYFFQKTYFELVEEGLDPESSGIVRLPEDARIPTKVFRADHPFVFMMVDKKTGLIILMGRVTCKDRFDLSMLRSSTGAQLVVPDMNRGNWVYVRNNNSKGKSRESDDETKSKSEESAN